MTGTHIALIALAAVAAAVAAVQVAEVRPHRPPQPEDVTAFARDAHLAHCRAMAHTDMQLDPALAALPPAPYAAERQARLRRCEDRHR